MEHTDAIVWFRKTEGFLKGKVLKKDNDKYQIIDSITNIKHIVHQNDIYPTNPDIQDGIDELTELSYLNDPAVLDNLYVRYKKDIIYTFSGPILIAINPYKWLTNITGPTVVNIGANAYQKMVSFNRNQSIIVTGESGAGKTETTKILLNYLADIGEHSDIGERIMNSTPILEAFGNAKTIRNDNSSRFGKFIRLGFDDSGKIIGAKLETYLLEKSRVVFQSHNERNFHIFYQLYNYLHKGQNSIDLPSLNHWKTLPTLQFHYLNLDGVDFQDDDLLKTQQAFHILGIDIHDFNNIISIILAILILGNIQFIQNDRDQSEITVDTIIYAQTAAKLIGCSAKTLISYITMKNITVGRESYPVNLTAEQSVISRDSLATFIYTKLFDWIVSKINQSITSKSVTNTFIGILDIYGFESFDINSLEQFCINYANEKLQQEFNHHMFHLEQEEYIKEGIEWSNHVKFNDNRGCISLIENKNIGILDILNEESKLTRSSSETFVRKLSHTHKRQPYYRAQSATNSIIFGIQHYPGLVEYHSTYFIDKNRNSSPDKLLSILRTIGENEFLKKILFQANADVNKYKSTIVSNFRESLTSLLQVIRGTESNYIRCIKPNDIKSPDNFNLTRVLEQLKCCGVFESIRIAKDGYPTRVLYETFYQRYNISIPWDIRRSLNTNTSAEEWSKHICKPFADPSVKYGLTKLFLKSGILAKLENTRSQLTYNASTILQSHIRKIKEVTRLKSVINSITVVQTCIRRRLDIEYAKKLRRNQAITVIQRAILIYNIKYILKTLNTQYRAVVTVQSHVRKVIARRKYIAKRKAIITIQGLCRCRVAKYRLKRLKHDKYNIDSLNNTINTLNTTISDLRNTILDKEDRIETLELDKLSTYELDYNNRSYMTKNQELQDEFKRRESQISTQIMKYKQEIEKNKIHASTVIKIHEDKYENMHKVMTQLQDKLTQEKHMNQQYISELFQKFKDENTYQEIEYKHAEEEINNVSNTYARHISEYSKLLDSNEKELTHIISEHKRKEQLLELEITEQQAEIKKYADSSHIVTNEINTLKSNNSTLKLEIDNLEQTFTDIKIEKISLQNSIDSIQTELTSVTQQNIILKSECNDLEVLKTELNSVTEQNIILKSECNDLEVLKIELTSVTEHNIILKSECNDLEVLRTEHVILKQKLAEAITNQPNKILRLELDKVHPSINTQRVTNEILEDAYNSYDLTSLSDSESNESVNSDREESESNESLISVNSDREESEQSESVNEDSGESEHAASEESEQSESENEDVEHAQSEEIENIDRDLSETHNIPDKSLEVLEVLEVLVNNMRIEETLLKEKLNHISEENSVIKIKYHDQEQQLDNKCTELEEAKKKIHSLLKDLKLLKSKFLNKIQVRNTHENIVSTDTETLLEKVLCNINPGVRNQLEILIKVLINSAVHSQSPTSMPVESIILLRYILNKINMEKYERNMYMIPNIIIDNARNTKDSNTHIILLNFISVIYMILRDRMGVIESESIRIYIKHLRQQTDIIICDETISPISPRLNLSTSLRNTSAITYGYVLFDVINAITPIYNEFLDNLHKISYIDASNTSRLIIEEIMKYIRQYHKYQVFSSIYQQLLKHMIYHIDTILFNRIMNDATCCTFDVATKLLTFTIEFSKRLKSNGIDIKCFRYVTQLINCMLSDKISILSNRSNICPDFSLHHLRRFYKYYTPDTMDKYSILKDLIYNIEEDPVYAQESSDVTFNTLEFTLTMRLIHYVSPTTVNNITVSSDVMTELVDTITKKGISIIY